MRIRCLLLALAWVGLTGSTIQASSPALSSIRPTGAQRGTEVEVALSGERLGDAQEILWYQPGIEVLSIEKVDDNNVKAKLRIGGEARTGLYDFRVRTATGLSHLRTFSVGLLPDVAEQEPNNDFQAPQAVPMNVTINGVAENEDVDHYVVEAKKGDRITAEVEGIRLGITLFDPYVAILDEKRFELSSSDDLSLVRQDGVAQIVAPEDGKYIIQVRESSYQGNGACVYRLHVGNFPRPRAIVPAGGPAGETIEMRWIGDVAGEFTSTISVPSEPTTNHGVYATDAHGTSPYPNPFRVSPFGNVIEAEPNENHDQATPFTAPMGLNGVIEKEGDIDHFVFPAKKGETYEVNVYARSLGSPLDSVLYIAKKGGGAIASADDVGGPDSSLRLSVPEDGEYVVFLHDHLRKGSPTHFYRIEVRPVGAQLNVSPFNENPQIGVINVPVPKGNRVALVINARRADFGGDLAFSAEGLPPGAAMESDVMTGNIAQMPVLFTAPADAAVGGSLARIHGKHTDANIQVPSSFSQTIELVQGANNVPFWTRSVDDLAVAVTEEAPYTIEVVEPKVPVVRGGSMNLKVVAKRKEGFTAPIAVSLPWNPPGIGSAGGVAIPEGQNEALIPVNADGGAPLQTWKIVVNGTSSGPTGPIMVSSQLVPLTIAERFVTLEYSPAAAEQGKETQMLVKVNKATDFPGEATVKLIGLPHNVTTEDKTISKDTTELVFPIKVGADSPVGKHPNLFCQVVITQEGEPILHNLGSGELRVDAPLPPKPTESAAAAPMPKAEEKPAPPKPLSRLEQLRLEQAERAKAEAAKAGTQGGGD